MKKILFTAIAVFIVMRFGMAQSCSQFINAVNGKKLVYSNLDAKGKGQGKINYTSTKKDASTITVHTEILDKNGQSASNSDSEISCNGDAISIDMKSFIPPGSVKQFNKMQMQGDGKYLVYPLNLKAGQTLEDGSVNIIITNDGHQMGNIQMDITNRKVEQEETVNTAAGDFNCFRISYDAALKVKMMGIGFPVRMRVTEWFAPKLARFVKSETYSKNNKLMGTTQLESIN